jgi:cell division protein FtsZ
LEVCVIGTTDVGNRSATARRPLAAVRSVTPAPAKIASERPAGGTAVPFVAVEAAPVPPVEQNEFTFSEMESRGYFDKTERHLFEGQDLDVPTYLRKGIKIPA